MGEVTIPLEPEALTDVLTRAGALRDGHVTRIEADNIGAGKGYAGLSLRLSLKYAPEGTGPATLVLKAPSAGPGMRRRAAAMGAYVVEQRFYTELSSSCGLATPGYYGCVELRGFGTALLMEDLGHLRLIDQVTSCSLSEARRVLDDLARLHARWWNDERLETLAWVPTIDDADHTAFWAPRTLKGVPAWQTQEADVLPPRFLELAPRLAEAQPQLAARLSAGKRTLLHGDARLENIFFDDTDSVGPGRLVWFDWQLCRRGRPGREVAYFLGGNLDEALLCQHRDTLLHHYHERLCALGVDGYDYADLWHDYRLGLLADLSGRFYWATVIGPVLEMIRTMEAPELKASYEKGLASALRLGKGVQARIAPAIADSDADTVL